MSLSILVVQVMLRTEALDGTKTESVVSLKSHDHFTNVGQHVRRMGTDTLDESIRVYDVRDLEHTIIGSVVMLTQEQRLKPTVGG
jgi:hypothetical protein